MAKNRKKRKYDMAQIMSIGRTYGAGKEDGAAARPSRSLARLALRSDVGRFSETRENTSIDEGQACIPCAFDPFISVYICVYERAHS